ncbi:MAG: hypothetical protein HY657_04085 [Acidobacteria bacterium]|nr:hypothetical protein [Acidobacteriota bacterium]
MGTASTYVNGVSRRLKASRIVTDTVLEPTATGCFLVFADFPATVRVPSVELVVTSSDTYETEPLRGRVTVEGAISQRADAFGDLTASGQVKNTGDRLTYFTEIWMEATDAEGKLLDCGATSVEGSSVVLDRGVPRTGLAPAEVGVFENFTEAVFASVNKLRYSINWDEPEQQQPIPATARYWELKERLAAASATHEGASSPRERAELRDALRREIRSIEQRLTQP